MVKVESERQRTVHSSQWTLQEFLSVSLSLLYIRGAKEYICRPFSSSCV